MTISPRVFHASACKMAGRKAARRKSWNKSEVDCPGERGREREREREREGASSSRGMIWSAGPMHAAPRYNYWSYVSDTQSRMNYRGTTPPASAQPGTTMPAHHEQRPDCRWCVLIVPRGFRPQYPDPVTRFFPPVTRGHSLFLVSSSRTEMKIPYTFTNAYSIQMVSLAKFIY